MDKEQNIPYRPLGILTDMIEGIGLQITHVYEDLLFVEHNAFLLRMEKKGEDVSVFFNVDSETEKRPEIFSILAETGSKDGFNFERKGCYRLDVDIVFLDDQM